MSPPEQDRARPSLRVRFGGKSDVGRQRDDNEDAFLLLDEYCLAVVCDGLGGHRSGRVASELAVNTVRDFFIVTVRPDATWPFPYDDKLTDEENYLFTGLRLANRRIFDRSLKTLSDFGMGTTAVGVMFALESRELAIANVGDSRLYRIRGDVIEALTRDHSLVSDAMFAAPWMTQEEIAQLPPNVITRALGIREEVQIDVRREPLLAGDVYLLCSDGLSGQVPDAEVLEVVSFGLKNRLDLDAIASALVDRANDAGGEDNVTVVLCQVVEAEQA